MLWPQRVNSPVQLFYSLGGQLEVKKKIKMLCNATYSDVEHEAAAITKCVPTYSLFLVPGVCFLYVDLLRTYKVQNKYWVNPDSHVVPWEN